MKRTSMTEVKRKLDSLIKRKKGKPVIITRHRKAVAALVYLNGDEESEAVIAKCAPKLHTILDRARARLAHGKGIPHDEFWKEVGASRRTPKRR